MANYVFTLGLIPVQDWIAQARRSRDLRAGSVFLWHLVARLLTRLRRELAGVEIWTPKVTDTELDRLAGLSFGDALAQPYGIPNRASGWCSAQDDRDLRRAFQALEGEVAVAWREFRDEGMGWLKRVASASFWSDVEPHWAAYRNSTSGGEDAPLTLVWSALPAPHPHEQRRENLEAAFGLFADVKRSRPARAWPFGKPVGKCTQCGQREAMGPIGGFNAWQRWHSRQDEDPWIATGYRLDPGERLCYVCLAKRSASYEERESFPSTGEVAARCWLKRVEKVPELKEIVDRLRSTPLGREDFGRALLGSIKGLPEEEREEVLNLRSEIRKAIGRYNLQPGVLEPISPTPPTYLALIVFDGDDMGRRVLADPEGTPQALASFAHKARARLEEKGAERFYLAGDEGLAMAPAETALDLVFELRAELTAAFAEIGGSATLSAGIAFFEHGRPMRGAILAAHKALRSAKEMEGKSALGVAVETASGSRWGLTAHWGDDWTRIRQAAKLIRTGRLSPGWAYDAERFLETLPADEWNTAVAEAARAELRRLFLRRVRVDGKTAADRREARRQEWELLGGNTWWRIDSHGAIPPPQPQQLHLIGFLARQASALEAGAAEETGS